MIDIYKLNDCFSFITSNLTTIQIGAYAKILCYCKNHDNKIAACEDTIKELLCVKISEWNRIRPVLNKMFVMEDNYFIPKALKYINNNEEEKKKK